MSGTLESASAHPSFLINKDLFPRIGALLEGEVFKMRKISWLLGIGLAFAITTPALAQPTEAAKQAPTEPKVLVIFVDSLRPDVVDSMVAKGQLPCIKKLFYDKGRRFPNFFSVFPSLTVNAFGSLVTGKWADQSGLKAQSLFERFPVRKKNIVKRAFFVPERFPRFFNMLTAVERAPAILRQNKVKALYDYLGEKYHTSVIPVSPSVAPWAWPHIAANSVERPYRVAVEAAAKIDDLNGQYGLRYMVPDTRGKLFMIWFTEMDEEQHRHDEGQFNPEVQKRMIAVDQWLEKIYAGFIHEDNGAAPYVILFSDHGAYGGVDGIYNQPYYLGRDFFYKIKKMNVRGPDYVMHHPGTDNTSFTYIDNMGRGQARIFLPVGDISSGKWDRPNTLYELRHYGLGPNRKPIDLIQELLDIDLSARNKFPGKISPYPVDLLIVKISEDLIYLVKRGGGEAFIRIEKRNKELFCRYEPVRNVSQDAAGKLTFETTLDQDPLGYLKHPLFHAADARQFIQEFHNDQEWLDATFETDYPDAISAIAHALSWRSELAAMAKAQDPDIWLSATPGWNFRIEEINGADHGSIYKDSLRSTLMMSGPHIQPGVDPTPYRIINVTPTLFQLGQFREKTDFCAAPIKGIYEN